MIQASRLQGGKRRVTYITEVLNMENDMILTQDIFKYVQEGVNPQGKAKGKFVATGIRPKCIERLEECGIRLPNGIFRERVMLVDE